jgi:hypothetical protein
MKLKSAGKSGAGEALVHCPVCNEVYLRYSLVQHWSQMAGKEAQYEMARVIYLTMENKKREFPLGVAETMDNCPHWKFLLSIKKAPNARPVARRENQSNWYSALQAYLAEK